MAERRASLGAVCAGDQNRRLVGTSTDGRWRGIQRASLIFRPPYWGPLTNKFEGIFLMPLGRPEGTSLTATGE